MGLGVAPEAQVRQVVLDVFDRIVGRGLGRRARISQVSRLRFSPLPRAVRSARLLRPGGAATRRGTSRSGTRQTPRSSAPERASSKPIPKAKSAAATANRSNTPIPEHQRLRPGPRSHGAGREPDAPRVQRGQHEGDAAPGERPSRRGRVPEDQERAGGGEREGRLRRGEANHVPCQSFPHQEGPAPHPHASPTNKAGGSPHRFRCTWTPARDPPVESAAISGERSIVPNRADPNQRPSTAPLTTRQGHFTLASRREPCVHSPPLPPRRGAGGEGPGGRGRGISPPVGRRSSCPHPKPSHLPGGGALPRPARIAPDRARPRCGVDMVSDVRPGALPAPRRAPRRPAAPPPPGRREARRPFVPPLPPAGWPLPPAERPLPPAMRHAPRRG